MINLPKEQLKKILLKEELVDGEKFESMYENAQRRKHSMEDVLVSEGVVTRDYLYNLISQNLNIPRVKLQKSDIDRDILYKLPENVARQKGAVPFSKADNGAINVAMEDPTDLEAINFLNVRLAAPINAYLAMSSDLETGYALYGQKQTQDFKEIIEESVKETMRSEAKGVEEAAQDVPVVAIFDNLLAYANSLDASDIHFDVLEDKIMVRFRIDGILHEMIRMPTEILPALVARVKILSDMRIDEHSKPQDGRFRYKAGNTFLDIRVSVIPTFYGEKVEMRLLEASQKPLALSELGMLTDTADIVENAINTSYGMIPVCGPTGSGKTTTLYSVMNMLNDPEVNIVTIEDPIEYDMRYVNQTQVNPEAGIDFASGLRSLMRQDPDIIMVGEIRDSETAKIAVQAALTGHIVLSTLHTNDAPTAIPRLVDMGVKPFLAAAVLNAVLAQRLVRKIHTECVESYVPDDQTYKAIKRQLEELGMDSDRIDLPKRFYRGRGCDACGGLGYKGRVGIFEIMDVDDKIKDLIVDPAFNMEDLGDMARKQGMVTMFEDGLRKVERGVTTVEEVFRVIRE